MRKHASGLLVAAVTAAAMTGVTGGAAASAVTRVALPTTTMSTTAVAPVPSLAAHHVVARFAPGAGGAFAESMARLDERHLIVSLTQFGTERADGSWTDNFGQLFTVATNGRKSAFGPRVNLGACAQFMGVAVDPARRVFVAVGNFDSSCGSASPASGVYRVRRNGFSRVMTLPAGVFANGLTVHRGQLYVTDSHGGAVYRGPALRTSSPTTPWFSDVRLTPTTSLSIGANGIASRDGRLYLTGYARGNVIAVAIDRHGRPGRVELVAHDPRLVRADGITFDPRGRLWASVNPTVDFTTMTQTGEGSIVSIDRRGRISTLPVAPGWLDYPTQSIWLRGKLYVANGAFVHGTPSVVAIG